MGKSTPRTSRSLLSCEGQGGKERVKNRIITFLIIWIVLEIVAYLLSWFMFGSLVFLWVVDPIWILITVISILGWLSGVITIYYILLFFFSCRNIVAETEKAVSKK